MLILISLAAWAVPVQMTQQGRVVDSSGVPLEGTHIFEYRIYDSDTGGNVVWDEAMVEEHKGKWATVFSGWVQHLLDDERSNAFSAFVCDETCRVLSGSAALQVPGT